MVVVIDDFFEDFEQVLKETDQHKFYTPEQGRKLGSKAGNFRGIRTLNLLETANYIRENIENALKIHLGTLYFHKHDCMPGVKGNEHRDVGMATAGVIYLKGAQGCGTEVDGNLIEFKENRLISYDAQLLHRPQGFEADRMVITFFSKDHLPDH